MVRILCSSWINEWLWLVYFMYKHSLSPLVYASSEVTKSLSCTEWKIRVVVGKECCWRNKNSVFYSVSFVDSPTDDWPFDGKTHWFAPLPCNRKLFAVDIGVEENEMDFELTYFDFGRGER